HDRTVLAARTLFTRVLPAAHHDRRGHIAVATARLSEQTQMLRGRGRRCAMGDAGSLRELHDAYVWEVNAAVGEDRMDLVWRLADEYTDAALRLITEMESPGCGRADCVMCARPRSAPALPARRGWLRWAHRRHAV